MKCSFCENDFKSGDRIHTRGVFEICDKCLVEKAFPSSGIISTLEKQITELKSTIVRLEGKLKIAKEVLESISQTDNEDCKCWVFACSALKQIENLEKGNN